VAYLRLLARTGKTAKVVAYATSQEELFIEFGISDIAKPILRDAVRSPSVSAHDRFWALDTLTFWSYQRGNEDEFERNVGELESICEAGNLGDRERAAIALKKMLLFGRRGEVAEAERQFDLAKKAHATDPTLLRIFRYNFAHALYKAGRYGDAERISSGLILEYYDVLDLEPQDVIFKNPPEIAEKLADTTGTYDDLKRLADTLEMFAMCCMKQGKPSGLARLHAHKFFLMCDAYTSAVRVGQDAVDELLDKGDTTQALQMLEKNLLPMINEFKLMEHIVPVRAHRATVLAYAGRHQEALSEIEKLRAFAVNGPGKPEELERQHELIRRICRGELTLRTAVPTINMLGKMPFRPPAGGKIGRNEPCPCRSGKKYKKCCGAVQ
jgi:tetratricopeptide (TPR) repeat protein